MRSLLQVFEGRTRRADLEPIGVIDIGSNSVRLVVYEGAVRSATTIFNEKVLCGLGRTVASTGRLGEDSVQRALAALVRFRAVARVLGVKYLRAVATAAVREASNGPEFIAEGEKACGVKIQILNGQKEAELAAQGIMMGFVGADGIAGDLGGGSLEVIDIADGKLNESATLPLGGLRLIDTTQQKLDRALVITDDELSRLPWIDKGRGRTFYAVGGTWRAIARLHMEAVDYPLRVIDGYRMATAELVQFCQALRKTKKLTGRSGLADVARARREVLPYGALVLERLLARLEPSHVVFSIFGIREGLIFSLLPEHERQKDPLLSFCEDFAHQKSRSVVHARELCDWTDAVFAGPGMDELPDERRLRYAACLISDTGWRAHPDYRGEQSLNTIAHAALGGLDHPGRIFLALSIYFRHAGAGESHGEALSDRLTAAVNRRALRRARVLGAAIRTAHMLSVGMPGVIPDTPLSYEDGKLVLTLPAAFAALDGERLRRRFESLAELLERHPVIRVER